MTALITLKIIELRGSIYHVDEIHDDGRGGMLAEFRTRQEAVAFATDYSTRFGIALESAEVVHLNTRGDVA